MTHGTRTCYQQTRCRCLLCRAANARYIQALRCGTINGHRPLGSYISAVEAHRRITQMKAERFTQAEIARRLGLKRPLLEVHPVRIRLRTLLRLRRLVRLYVQEAREPNQLNG